MNKYVGIWIDHRKAVIVSLIQKKQSIFHVESNVEGHFRLKGGSRSKDLYGPQDATSESKREERYKHYLQDYFKRVIDLISDASRIIIFGPGEAKHEFVKEIKKKKALAGKIDGVETKDKMTERQIAAKVRSFYISKA